MIPFFYKRVRAQYEVRVLITVQLVFHQTSQPLPMPCVKVFEWLLDDVFLRCV